MAYKYITYKEVGTKEFENTLTQILNLPINKREDFDSLDEIEKAMVESKEKNLEIIQLQQRDYNFLKSQLDYALAQRFLQNPKQWRTFIQCVDEASGKRPDEFFIKDEIEK